MRPQRTQTAASNAFMACEPFYCPNQMPTHFNTVFHTTGCFLTLMFRHLFHCLLSVFVPKSNKSRFWFFFLNSKNDFSIGFEPTSSRPNHWIAFQAQTFCGPLTVFLLYGPNQLPPPPKKSKTKRKLQGRWVCIVI